MNQSNDNKLLLNDFPDKPARQGSPIPPTTIPNLAYLLEMKGIECRYDQVKKKVEIHIPGHSGTTENSDESALTAIISLVAGQGMGTGQVGPFVNAIADTHAYNPVADWINSKPWDGEDRLQAFCDTVHAQEGYTEVLKRILLEKWLRSAVAAAMKPGYKGRGVLTFQGPQGIGKTSWVRALVSDPDLADRVIALDHHLDISNKDTIISAISHWIVEIGELDSSFKKDVARLKGFITRDKDTMRRPYARTDSTYDRRTLFVATVNDGNFLVDTTGNSRWWTIAVDKLDYDHLIDMQQLFAQVSVDVAAGKQWWLTQEEEGMLAKANQHHLQVSVVADAVRDQLDQNLNPASGVSVTASQLLIISGFKTPTNAQAKECGALLRELYGPPKRVQGRERWRVPLRKPTAADLNSAQRADLISHASSQDEVY